MKRISPFICISYCLFVFFNNANTVSAEMWVWGFGNHAWYKSLLSSHSSATRDLTRLLYHLWFPKPHTHISYSQHLHNRLIDTSYNLRRRKNYKPNENEEEDLDEVLRPVQPTVPTYSSLQVHNNTFHLKLALITFLAMPSFLAVKNKHLNYFWMPHF